MIDVELYDTLGYLVETVPVPFPLPRTVVRNGQVYEHGGRSPSGAYRYFWVSSYFVHETRKTKRPGDDDTVKFDPKKPDG